MFTMTATKYSTCPVSGLTIEPGDTITRAGNKYTPWSLTKSEIDRKQRIARSMPTPAPKPSGICPECAAPIYAEDVYCGMCGYHLQQIVTNAYTIATDDERPAVIAEVRHIDATPRRYAMLGTEAQATPFQVAAPDTTPEPIAPQKQPESRTEAPTPITADTVTEQYAYINPKDLVSLMVSATKQVRDDIKQARVDAKAEGTKYDSFHGLRESVRIITLPDGTIYAGQLMGDDAGQTTCTKGTGIDACFDQDQASALARYMIDTKSRIPRMVRLSIEGKYLVIEQESTVKGRWDKMRFAHQIEPTNTGQMSGWPARKQEQQAA